MPIYEYKCADCGHRLEAIQKVSEPLLVECPTCGKAALKRLISAAGFQLKGSGWYVTDFKNNVQKKDSQSKDSQKKDSEKGKENGSSSSDSGPAAAEKSTQS